MNGQLTARVRGVALVALAAGMTTASAYAAGAPSAQSPETTVTMSGGSAAETVHYRGQVNIAGRLRPRAQGTTVRLQHAPGRGGFRALARTRTRADGTYRFAVRPRRSASFRALAHGAATSAAKRVTVVSRLSTRATRHVRGGSARVRGTLRPGFRGRRVNLQVRTRRGWRTVDRARTGRGGRFATSWRPRGPGVYRLRVRSAGDRYAAATGDRLARVYAYRPGHASWYGPGLYGNRLACGGTLTPGTLGVAHKSLPCGTRVRFRYRGRSVTVRVIDRGPFVAGRTWDLTAATKQRLGFGSTGTVWATR